MKAMKRLYSYNNIKDPKNKQLELTMLFYSDIGYINKIRSDFELVILLGSQEFKSVHINIVKHNLQLLKYNLSFSKFNTIYNDFKQIFINSKNNDDIFITDFKCGEIKGEPSRWSYDDIMEGSKIILDLIQH